MTVTIGAHIRVWRGPHWHHAIYVGNGMVIHYSGLTKDKATAMVQQDTFETFRAGGVVEVVTYARAFPPHEVVRRAASRLGERRYDLVGNNCEHFARWCVTGVPISDQVHRIATGVSGAGGGSALTTGAVGAVVAVGEAAGLAGGAGVMHGLAATGGTVGVGAAGGLAVLAAAPAVATTLAVRHAYNDDPMLGPDERCARKAARDTTTVAAVGGTLGSLALVSAAGIPGLSAVGITSGLAAIGSVVGGGMLAGVTITIAAPALVAWILGRIAYQKRRP